MLDKVLAVFSKFSFLMIRFFMFGKEVYIFVLWRKEVWLSVFGLVLFGPVEWLFCLLTLSNVWCGHQPSVDENIDVTTGVEQQKLNTPPLSAQDSSFLPLSCEGAIRPHLSQPWLCRHLPASGCILLLLSLEAQFRSCCIHRDLPAASFPAELLFFFSPINIQKMFFENLWLFNQL